MESPQHFEHSVENLYSLVFLKNLYYKPHDHITTILNNNSSGNTNINSIQEKGVNTISNLNEENNNSAKRKILEKRSLLNYLKTVNEMKSVEAKQWTQLHHYLAFIYRHCIHKTDSNQTNRLSSYFVNEMRIIVTNLMKQDEIQLCLRLISAIRGFTLFALKQYQTVTSIEASIESLFYYYEAFLAATKNICTIFPELEQLLLGAYKLGWVELNASIFMYYFYEATFVQNINKDFELVKDSVSIKATSVYTILLELHRLWRAQILSTSCLIASKLGTKAKGLNLDNKLMAAHQNILSKNFWIDRSRPEILQQDKDLFAYQLFTLVGDKNLILPEAILNEYGYCICEECLIIQYKAVLENDAAKFGSNYTQVFCRLCAEYVRFPHLQIHGVTPVYDNIEEESCIQNSYYFPQMVSTQTDSVPVTCTKNSKELSNNKTKEQPEMNNHANSIHNDNYRNFSKEPSPKIASEPPPILNKCYEEKHKQDDTSKIHRKTFYNLTKQPDGTNKPSPLIPTTTINKSSNGSHFCGHNCKLEDGLKTGIKKETCENHKEPNKCDCTFCEVFGTSTNVKHNETRNRLRTRLNQRNEKISNKLSKYNSKQAMKCQNKNIFKKTESPIIEQSKVSNPTHVTENVITADTEEKTSNPLINDIHGLLNYIEGNTNTDKMVLAEKKAAKKARQRLKKEQERQRLVEEEKIKAEEEKIKAEEEKQRLQDKLKNEELQRQLAEKALKKELKKKKQRIKKEGNSGSTDLIEETIPAMVTIKRVQESENSLPTVTITLKSSTPDQDKLLYSLVNGHDNNSNNFSNTPADSKKSKKTKSQTNSREKIINLQVNSNNNEKKKIKNDKNNQQPSNNLITKELRVTLAVDSIGNNNHLKKHKNIQNSSKLECNIKQANANKKPDKGDLKKEKNRNSDLNIPMLKLPPGITITKVDGPMADRNYKTCNLENSPYNSNIPVSKSGVIVVDTEKLIKQSAAVASSSSLHQNVTSNKKSKKKKSKRQETINGSQTLLENKQQPSMVTLKNPIFQNMQTTRPENNIVSELTNGNCQQAAIFRNENGMVTIRSSRLQQSLSNNVHSSTPISNLLSDLKPVLGPQVSNSYTNIPNCTFSESSSFNAQEILSGLPGIEITKVDKRSTKLVAESRKPFHTAEVSIIPANNSNNSDKFYFDKDDLHYDNVFTPKDILEDDMDAEERELEAFKRFCQQSVPPKRKEKVAHLNVKDIVLKKKYDIIPG